MLENILKDLGKNHDFDITTDKDGKPKGELQCYGDNSYLSIGAGEKGLSSTFVHTTPEGALGLKIDEKGEVQGKVKDAKTGIELVIRGSTIENPGIKDATLSFGDENTKGEITIDKNGVANGLLKSNLKYAPFEMNIKDNRVENVKVSQVGEHHTLDLGVDKDGKLLVECSANVGGVKVNINAKGNDVKAKFTKFF